MKKLTCTLFLIFNFIILSIFNFVDFQSKVFALGNDYMRVLNQNAYIYQDDSFQTKLFIIPYGYFVSSLENYGDYYKVSYGSSENNCPTIIGYMKSENLTEYLDTPTKPYCIFSITSNYSDILFNDYDRQIPYFNLPKNSTLTYLGEYINENNEVLLYVYYNSKLGYVDKNSIKSFTVPVSPDKIKTPEDEVENEPTIENNDDFKKSETLQIIIIVGISIISISVVYFLFKPTKNKIEPKKDHAYEFYDEIE